MECNSVDNSFLLFINKNDINEQNINLYSFDTEINSKILITEGMQYINKLTQDINKISYVFFLTKRDLETKKEYIINFRKYSYDRLNLTINKDKNGLYTINRLSQFIFINSNEINCEPYSNQEFCEFIITIELGEEKIVKEIYYSFLLYDNNLIENNGIYLPKNTFMNGILNKYRNYNYYGTINKIKGEIYIDFLEGEGKAIIKMTNGKKYEFDYYNKKFDLSNCIDINCEFNLTISLPNYSPDNSTFKYNIYLKTPISNTIQIYPYEAIYGSLSKENKIHYYSVAKTNKNMSSELNCDFCKIYYDDKGINENKFRIELMDNIEKADYNFKIFFYENDYELNIFHINSLRNHHLCEINDANPCYYLAYIEKYNEVNNLQFFVQNNENVIIYLKKISKEYTEENIYDEIYKDAITYDIDTSNNNVKNYFRYPISEEFIEDEYYILIKVESYLGKKMKINLVYNIFEFDYSSLMNNIFKEDFILINSNFVEEINIKNKEYYIFDFNLITSDGQISIQIEGNTQTQEYILKPGFKDNLNIILSIDEIYYLTINDIMEKNSILSYRKIINSAKSNIKEISFGKSNFFSYKDIFEDFYLNYYLNLNEINIISDDIHLNYKLIQDYKNEFQGEIKPTIALVDKN
jgi:hypothetical protein